MGQDRLMIQVGQLAEQSLLLRAHLLGDFNEDLDEKISSLAGARIDHPVSLQREHVAVLSSRVNSKRFRPAQRWDVNFRAECCLAVGDRKLENQVGTITYKQIVRSHRDEDVAIPHRTAIGTGLSFTWHADTHPVIDTVGDTQRQFVFLVSHPRPAAVDAGIANLLSGT